MGHNNPPSEMEILRERLEAHVEQKETLERLSSKEIPESVDSEDEAGKITDHIKLLKVLRGDIEKIFKQEKSPFWDCCKAADEWKNSYWKKIDASIADASKPVLAWHKKKEEEERQRQLEIARKAQEEAEKLALEAEAHADAGIVDTADSLMNAAVQEDEKSRMIAQNLSNGLSTKSVGGFSTASNRKPWTGRLESRPALDLEALRNYFSDDALDKAIKSAVRDGVRTLRGATIFQENKLSVR